MKIVPLAFDSLGIRSTATFVETDIKILIDPGASLGPSRYGLPPSEREIEKLEELSELVGEYAKTSDYLAISHYHYDHFFPQAEFYKDKFLFLKDPKDKINRSQRRRAFELLNWIGGSPKKKFFADGKRFKFKKTKLVFSPPVFHGGDNSRQGYVLMCSILYEREKLIHASDVQGPQLDFTTDWIIDENPDILILSGFPTMFLGFRVSKESMDKSNRNLLKILTQTKVNTIILDHHLVRDLNYKEKIQRVLDEAQKLGKRILTAAEFLGKEPEFLEAKRKEIYADL
jgi:predicted metallo-beta-lactamase superfamily hydrolase